MNELLKPNVGYDEELGYYVSSRTVAKGLGKRHDNVMRDLKEITEGLLKCEDTPKNLIVLSTYTNRQNKQEYKEYKLTKDGFTLYMFNIQGYQEFKMAYINKFNEMERALKENSFSLIPPEEKEIKTFRGQPVMEILQLNRITGVPYSTLYQKARVFKSLLSGAANKEYRRENNIRRSFALLTILNKEQVISLCRYFGVYERCKEAIDNYFRIDNKIEFKATPEKVEKEKIFDDVYLETIYNDMKKIFAIESKIEKIYDEELKPLYDNIITLIKRKRDLGLSTFECMKYGGVTEKEKRN